MGKIAGVYKITNKENGKIYIGESENINRRWSEHITDLVSNKHCNNKLQNEFNFYSKDNFIFEIIESIEILDIKSISNIKLKILLICRESIFIKKYNSINKGYNIINTLKTTLEEQADMFQRNKLQDENERKIISYFVKNNPKVLNEDYQISINDIIDYSEIKNSKNNYYIKDLYKIYQSQNLLPNCITEKSFRNILSKNNLIYFENYSWYATQYSLDNKLMVLGKPSKNSYGYIKNEIFVTNDGIDIINNILELRKLNIELESINSP